MKAKVENYYRSKKTGLPVFVYVVSGTEAELSKYKEVQESVKLDGGKTAYVEDSKGRPLYFSTRPLSANTEDEVELMITASNKVVVNDLKQMFSQHNLLTGYIVQEQAKLMAISTANKSGIKAVADLTATRPVETAVHVAPELAV